VLVSVLFWSTGGARAGTSPFTDFWYGYPPNVRADLNDVLSVKAVDATGNAEVNFAVTADLIDPPGGTTHDYYEVGFQTTVFSHVTGKVGYSLYPGYYNPNLWVNGYNEIDLADDGGKWVSLLDWYFPYYGAWYDRVFVSANGFILFGQEGAVDTSVETIYTTKTPSTTYPNGADPDGVLAPLWRNLNPAAAGRVGYGFYLLEGYDTFVVAWEGVRNYANSNVQSFAIWLQPDRYGGSIKFLYKTLTKDVTTTVGMENPFGTAGMGDLYSQIGIPTPDLMSRLEFIPSSYNNWEITDVRIYAMKWYGDVGTNDKEAAIEIEGASDLGWGGLNVQLYDPGPSNPPPDFDDRTHRYINRVVDEIISDVAGANPVTGFLWGKYNYVKDLHSILTDYEYSSETTKDEPGRLNTMNAMAENLPQNNMNPSDKVFHLWTAPVFKWMLYDDELYTAGGLAAHEHNIALWAQVQIKRDDGSTFLLPTNGVCFKMGKCGVEGIQNAFYDNFDDGFIEVPTYYPGSLETWSVITGSNGDVSISPAGLGYSEDYSLAVDWTPYDYGLARVVSPTLPIDFTKDYSVVLYVNMTILGRNGRLVVVDDGRIEVFVKGIDLVPTLCVATSTGYIADREFSFNQWHRIVVDAFPSQGKFKLYLDSGGGMTLYDFKSPSGYTTIGFGSGSVSQGTYDAGEARWDDVGVFGYIIPLPSITVTSPNGGESWQMGTSHIITWSYANSPGSYVKIELYRASTLARTITSSTYCDGSYTWSIPTDLTAASDYRIRISSTSTSAGDYSDAYFSITAPPSITVTSPNGGESWQMGTSHTMTWTYANSPGSYVKIELYRASTLTRTITSSTACDGSYAWTVPTDLTAASDYRIKISSTSTAASDYSDAYFSITAPPSITVTSPNGGESWQMGSTQTITWTYADNPGSYVKIELYRVSTLTRTITSSTACDGSYSWTIPTDLAAASDYRIKVSSTSTAASDYSDAYFSITAVPSITVTSPNGGESWNMGTSHSITWTYANNPGSYVKIELYRSALVSTIASSTACDGSYTWTISTGLTAASDYRIKISSTSTAASDFSDASFTIAPQQVALTVTCSEGTYWTLPSVGVHYYDIGASVYCAAVADTGYKFKYWLVDGETKIKEQTFYITMDTSHTIYAYCTASGGGGGGGGPPDGPKLEADAFLRVFESASEPRLKAGFVVVPNLSSMTLDDGVTICRQVVPSER